MRFTKSARLKVWRAYTGTIFWVQPLSFRSEEKILYEKNKSLLLNPVSRAWFRYNLLDDFCFWICLLCMTSGGWLRGWLCTCLKDHCSLLHMNFSRVYFLWKHHFPLVYKFTTTTRIPTAAAHNPDTLHYWLDSAWKKSLMVPQTASKCINCIFVVCIFRICIMQVRKVIQQSTIVEITFP